MKLSLARIEKSCATCGGRNLDGGICIDCVPGKQMVPADRLKPKIYGRGTLFDTLTTMRDDGHLEQVDTEVAVLASEVERLLNMGDLPAFERPLSEADRTNALRQALQAIVASKQTSQKIRLEGKYVISAEVMRVLLGEVERLIRKYVSDPAALQDIGFQLANVQVRLRRNTRT